MFDLGTIVAMNRKSTVKVEDNHSRHCSYAGDASGVILHSAKLRNTGYLTPAQAKRFLAKWFSTNSAEKRDQIVESYFQ